MIDVIIPSYNRAASLRRVIDSYVAQPEFGKLILVDDCSTDDTAQFAEELSQAHPGKVIYKKLERKVSLPAVRNEGIKLATADLIFMGEDDVLLPADHFAVLAADLEKYGADIVAGRRIYMREGQTPEEARRVADADREPIFVRVPFEGYFERPVETAIAVPYVHSNSLMRRSVFDTMQYDPNYVGNAFREELDFYLRAHAAGKKIWLVPDTLSYHLKNTSVNKRGGSRRSRIVYEYEVWRNTIRCFWKNRRIFKKEFGVKNVFFFAIRSLCARYTYAAQRRLKTHA